MDQRTGNCSYVDEVDRLLATAFDPRATRPDFIRQDIVGYDEQQQQATGNDQKASKRSKKKRISNARIGYCQHPKHMFYRQEQHESSDNAIANTPRRGRPPKGTKAIEKKQWMDAFCQPVAWAMTVRPLPRRLENVVGLKDIRVCLTCLKRSDTDPQYLKHPAYVAPQSLKRSSIAHS